MKSLGVRLEKDESINLGLSLDNKASLHHLFKACVRADSKYFDHML